jgi:hypothetical protein
LPQLMLNNLEKILQSAKFLYSGGTSGFWNLYFLSDSHAIPVFVKVTGLPSLSFNIIVSMGKNNVRTYVLS